MANTAELSQLRSARHGKNKLKVLAVGGSVKRLQQQPTTFCAKSKTVAQQRKQRDGLIKEPQRNRLSICESKGIEVGFMDFSWTKYKAACMLSFMWNRGTIEYAVEKYL